MNLDRVEFEIVVLWTAQDGRPTGMSDYSRSFVGARQIVREHRAAGRRAKAYPVSVCGCEGGCLNCEPTP